MIRTQRLATDLILVDTNFQQTPEAVGVYLLLGERPALVETGPASTVENVITGLRAAGIEPRDLQALAVTHIHLDHAGAAGTLVRRYPHLHVYVHPVGAPHLIDPARLLASASRLYGDDLHRLFGDVVPIPEARVHILGDESLIELGSRRLMALDTPGHARHHIAFLDQASGDLFTGDVAGVALPGSRYVRPPTPPPELDVEAWQKSLARLRALRPKRLLLTHFGPQAWVEELLTQLGERLRRVTEMVRQALAAGLNEEAITEQLRAEAAREMTMLGGSPRAARYDVVMPIRQNVQGLIRYAQLKSGIKG